MKTIKIEHLEREFTKCGILNMEREYVPKEVQINKWLIDNNIDADDIICIQYPRNNAYETGNTMIITYKVENEQKED